MLSCSSSPVLNVGRYFTIKWIMRIAKYSECLEAWFLSLTTLNPSLSVYGEPAPCPGACVSVSRQQWLLKWNENRWLHLTRISFRFTVCRILYLWDFHTNSQRVKLMQSHIFPPFQIETRNKCDAGDSSGPHMGAGGCRGYVYLQIRPPVQKQYLPGPFRYASAVKPWVQPSLCCVNLPSFSGDSISFLPPPNAPIHILIRSAQLTSKMLQMMVAI